MVVERSDIGIRIVIEWIIKLTGEVLIDRQWANCFLIHLVCLGFNICWFKSTRRLILAEVYRIVESVVFMRPDHLLS